MSATVVVAMFLAFLLPRRDYELPRRRRVGKPQFHHQPTHLEIIERAVASMDCVTKMRMAHPLSALSRTLPTKPGLPVLSDRVLRASKRRPRACDKRRLQSGYFRCQRRGVECRSADEIQRCVVLVRVRVAGSNDLARRRRCPLTSSGEFAMLPSPSTCRCR